MTDEIKDGPYESYLFNSQLMSKGTYKDGKLNGWYVSFYYDGQLREKGTYKDGEKCGEWEELGDTVTYDPC